jgi:hypothetical protein
VGPIVVGVPSFSVGPGGENTQCAVLDLGNSTPIHVGEVAVTLGDAVYELVVGASSGGGASALTSCSPFGTFADATVTPLVVARNRAEDVAFPAGVGYSLAAHQLLRVEIHAFNPGASALATAATVTFTPMADAAFQHEAGLIFVDMTSTKVSIPARTSNVDSGRVFTPLSAALGAASFTRLEGYTHLLGVDMAVNMATSAADPGTTIYAPVWDASRPPVVTETPPVLLPASSGVVLECFWSNGQGAAPVTYGPSVHDERCAAIISYFPAASVHYCMGSLCM